MFLTSCSKRHLPRNTAQPFPGERLPPPVPSTRDKTRRLSHDYASWYEEEYVPFPHFATNVIHTGSEPDQWSKCLYRLIPQHGIPRLQRYWPQPTLSRSIGEISSRGRHKKIFPITLATVTLAPSLLITVYYRNCTKSRILPLRAAPHSTSQSCNLLAPRIRFCSAT